MTKPTLSLSRQWWKPADLAREIDRTPRDVQECAYRLGMMTPLSRHEAQRVADALQAQGVVNNAE